LFLTRFVIFNDELKVYRSFCRLIHRVDGGKVGEVKRSTGRRRLSPMP